MMNPLPFVLLILLFCVPALSEEAGWSAGVGRVVSRDQRKALIVTEFGEISSVDINVGHRGPYHIQFFTLEPNSLFLPVLLHTDMIFYTHTGNGRVTWADEGGKVSVDIRKGDIYRVPAGSVLYVQSGLETAREKLRIYAIFDNSDDDQKSYEPAIGAYSSVTDLVKGFDRRILQAAFGAPEELVEAILNATGSPGIVHAISAEKPTFWELEARFLKALVGGHGAALNKKKRMSQTYNIFDQDPDFKNCNGWSLTVNKKNFKPLRQSDIGLFMVNLSTNSMMAPHWNPLATEIAIVLHGEGMVRTVCSNNLNKSDCKNTRFKVKEGDVFTVPRFHAMAHMSYSNDSLVFVGFSTTKKRNYPQFVAGRTSALHALDNQVLAWSFNVSVPVVEQLLASQTESIILECLACAEDEERLMVEEEERKREEEEEERQRKEEEEARRREEERRKEEEEEARKREEEERKRREEEEERKEEEEEEEARRREEEERKRREEEEDRKRKEEEERKKREEEEEERKRKEEEEAARKKKEEEREREERKKQEEAAQREQEEAWREAEEAAKKREKEEKREKKERKREERRKQEEEESQREQEERSQEEKQEEVERQVEEMKERERLEEEERIRQREEEQARRHENGWGPEQEKERSESAAEGEEKEYEKYAYAEEEKEDEKYAEETKTEREHRGTDTEEWKRIFKFWNI